VALIYVWLLLPFLIKTSTSAPVFLIKNALFESSVSGAALVVTATLFLKGNVKNSSSSKTKLTLDGITTSLIKCMTPAPAEVVPETLESS